MNIESFKERLVHGGDTEFKKELPNGYGLLIMKNTPYMYDDTGIDFVYYDLTVYRINSLNPHECYNLNNKLQRIYGYFCKDLNKILDVCDVIEELPKV